MEENKKPSLREFAQKYVTVNGDYPEWREHDLQFFDLIDQARKEGKTLIYSTRSPHRWLEFVESLYHTIKSGKEVYVPGMDNGRLGKAKASLENMGLKISVEECSGKSKYFKNRKEVIGHIFKLSE